MNNKFYIFCLVAIFSLASCTIEKRLHTEGFSVSWHSTYKNGRNKIAKSEVKPEKAPMAPTQTEFATVTKSENTPKVEEKVAPKVEESVENNVAMKSLPTQQIPADMVASTNNATPTIVAQENAPEVAPLNAKQAKKLQKIVNKLTQSNQTSAAGGGTSTGMLILYIILCLFPFINLIPVYLHDGKSVTMNFWVTLILDLLILGIIFALLVVLDVVNLG